jgi:[ribosomal protein S18]-alanine N-acetyltransferase
MTPDELARLHARCFDGAPRPWSAAEFVALSRLPGAFLVHCPGGLAVGRVAGPEAELLTLAVDPDRRRLGIARGLLERLEAGASARGAREIFLEVAGTNEAARALYGRQGYREVGRRPGYYTTAGTPPVDALVLAKRLAPVG